MGAGSFVVTSGILLGPAVTSLGLAFVVVALGLAVDSLSNPLVRARRMAWRLAIASHLSLLAICAVAVVFALSLNGWSSSLI